MILKLLLLHYDRGGLYPASACLKISGFYGEFEPQCGSSFIIKSGLLQRTETMSPYDLVPWTAGLSQQTQR